MFCQAAFHVDGLNLGPIVHVPNLLVVPIRKDPRVLGIFKQARQPLMVGTFETVLVASSTLFPIRRINKQDASF